MRARALLLLLPLVAACTPWGQARTEWLSGFVDRPEVELIAALGVPDRIYESGGLKFLAFTESQLDILPGMSTFGPPFWGVSQGFPAQVVQRQCETTVTVSDGIVRNFSFRGNAC